MARRTRRGTRGRRRHPHEPLGDPKQLSPAKRKQLQAQLATARADFKEKRSARIAAKKAPAVVAMRTAGRDEHGARMRVRRLERKLGIVRSWGRRRRLRPQTVAARKQREQRWFDELATHVFVAVAYDGHDRAVDDTMLAVVKHFGGECLGSGFSFVSGRRDLDFRFNMVELAESTIAQIGAKAAKKTHPAELVVNRLLAACSALMSNAPVVRIQFTTHVVFHIDGEAP